jgi:hypothetical protein
MDRIFANQRITLENYGRKGASCGVEVEDSRQEIDKRLSDLVGAVFFFRFACGVHSRCRRKQK